jgi:hypothetical protein
MARAPVRPEPDDGGKAATPAGVGHGRTAARASIMGADRAKNHSGPPRLEAYVQHTMWWPTDRYSTQLAALRNILAD